MGATCGDTPVLIGTIPNGIVIPARGHYFFVGSAYSLGAYAAGDQTLSSDIESDKNVAIFRYCGGRQPFISYSSGCRWLWECRRQFSSHCRGTRPDATWRKLPGLHLRSRWLWQERQSGNHRSMSNNPIIDTNNNSDDFVFADTLSREYCSGQRLGAPVPKI